MRARLALSMISWAGAALLLAGCLPGDTRPVPGVVHVTVEPSAAVTEGFTTVDGWHISFERLLVGLGSAALGGRGIGGRRSDQADCNSYVNAGYERLFDLTASGKQKLADLYGLGTCGVRLRLRTPGSDALLGEGVSARDLEFMRVQETDAVVTNGRRTVHVRGQATRDATTLRFEWSFRLGFELHGCAGAGGVGFASDVDLAGNEPLPLPVIVHGEELFRESVDDGSPLRFDALAAADADGDDVITLDELAGPLGPVPDADAGAPSGVVLRDVIYQDLLPRMIRLGDSGPCVGDPR